MSFVGDFHRYLKTRTDAPPDFHVHAAMAALAFAMGSNVWCDGWGRPIYPNLWIVIIARSGLGKSVPLDMSRSIVEMAGLGDGILPSSFSQEALYAQLGQHPTGIFYLQEFSAFVGLIHREYNAGAQAWLTDVFDVPEIDRRILRKETITMHKPCLTMLGASSPDWFAETFKESSLRGGFLARFMFCPNNDPGEYVGFPGPRDMAAESALAGHLRLVSELDGRANVDGIRKKFNEWDREARERLRKDCPPEFSGMRSRAGLMVLKASMIFHVSSQPDSLDINVTDLDNAIRYVEHTHKLAEKYLSEEVATDRYEVHRLKLLEIINRNNGRVPWSKALQNSHLSGRDFKSAVDTLVEAERLQIDTPAGSKQRFLKLPPLPIPIRSYENGNGRH